MTWRVQTFDMMCSCVVSKINSRQKHKHRKQLKVEILKMNVSCDIWMSQGTHTYVWQHMNESSDTYEWVMSHILNAQSECVV